MTVAEAEVNKLAEFLWDFLEASARLTISNRAVDADLLDLLLQVRQGKAGVSLLLLIAFSDPKSMACEFFRRNNIDIERALARMEQRVKDPSATTMSVDRLLLRALYVREIPTSADLAHVYGTSFLADGRITES